MKAPNPYDHQISTKRPCKVVFIKLTPSSGPKWKWKLLSYVQLFVTPWTVAHQSPLWNPPGKKTGVGSHCLLQGIFWTQGSNPGLPHCRWILYKLSHQGSSRILEWVAYPFSSRSFWLRNWTRVSCIAGEFFTNWDIREPLTCLCASEFEPQGISGPSMHHPVNRKKIL